MSERTPPYNGSPLVAIGAMFLCAANAFAQVSDRTTLTGKILPGYQGWFYCPGDGNDPVVGWRHWSKSTTQIGPNLYGMDLWPEVSEYPSVFPAPGVTLTFGGTAQLFSSITQSTTDKHFEWMRTYGLDGVCVQRFLSELADPTFFAARNTVLQHVLTAANTYGRTVTLEYDISGSAKSTLYTNLTNDWIYLSNTYNLRNNARYQYHNNKPVIIIWGLGFSDRPGTPTIANQIINFFKNDPTYGGCFCVGGVPGAWRTLGAPCKTDPAWNATYRSWHCINPWTVGAYNSSASITAFKNTYAAPDVTECNNLGIMYWPVVWPGFSWDNLMNLPPGTSNIDRRNGQHLWDQAFMFEGLSGVNKLFVAMFDECDEGTAIFKISDNAPNTNHWVGNNGYPQDWYMRLAGAAGQMARGEIPLSGTIPITPFPSNCKSGDVSIDLGTTDIVDMLTSPQPQGGDGNSTPVTIGGRNCRRNTNPNSDFYMYFGVDDSFAFQGACQDVYVKMDYYDTGGGTLQFQYDAVSTPYKFGPSVTVGNTNTWKTTTFHVTDAYFGNRQNGAMDFRIAAQVGKTFYLDVVRVAEKGPVSIFTANPASGTSPLVVAFNATTSYDPNGSISSYAWVFGDGGTGSGSTINHTYNSGGNFTAQLTTTDNSGNTDIATLPISVTQGSGQTPFGGTARTIPGTIQAEDYDNGGEGVAYHDTTSGNFMGGYRANDVDIEGCGDTGGGFNVGFIAAGEWLEYTVNVTSTGDHTIKARLASGVGGGTFNFSLNGNAITGNKVVAGTGGWQTYTTITIPAVFMSAGNNQILRFNMVTDGMNINKFDITYGGADAVHVDLDTTVLQDGMTHPVCCDGNTTGATIGGHNCRKNISNTVDRYMYFGIFDSYAFQGNRPNVWITAEYYDAGTPTLTLTYDATSSAYKNAAGQVLTNTNTWKTRSWNVTDGYFGNRENGAADFRLNMSGTAVWYIDTVQTSLSQP